MPDYRDLDSDNDGINDVIEGGNVTKDGNHDGMVEVRHDGDGIPNAVDGSPFAFADAFDPAPPDSDGNGIPDYQSLDSDSDGILDVVEGGNAALDANKDGIIDGPDTDGDGLIDAVDGALGTFGDANDPMRRTSTAMASGIMPSHQCHRLSRSQASQPCVPRMELACNGQRAPRSIPGLPSTA